MANEQQKILKNVLISAGENRLKLVDIIFNDKIQEIIPKSDKTVEWRDIATKEGWKEFASGLKSENQLRDFRVYEGRFLLLMPGAIDSHVHFNTPGFEERDDFEHGSLAAACGGVTTVIDMPCTSIPPVTSSRNLKVKMKAIDGRSWVDYAFWAGISGNELKRTDEGKLKQSMKQLLEMGVVGFKAYFISGMPTFPDLDFDEMWKVAVILKELDALLAVHAEDKMLVRERSENFQKKWRHDWQAYCQARDDLAEAKAVSKMIEIARRSGCKIHIVHLSSKLALDQLREAQRAGEPISTETCPHYLYFTQGDFANESIANYLKTAPPVKKAADREALWQGLADGTIAFVTTDHAGCDPRKEKNSWNFWEVYGGIPGVEHRVPFLFSEGFRKNRLTLSQTIALLSTNVAKFFKLNHVKGSLEPGKDADFALVNLWEDQEIRSEAMHSKGKYTPFEGVTLNAVVDTTFLRGKIVISSRGEAEIKCGYGKFVPAG